jgi:hemerythrin-like domain-containing protein
MCDHCGCREYAPIAELTAEHVAILELAEQLADDTRHHRPIDGDGRARLVDLLIGHVAKEEHGLYPMLIEQMGEPATAFDHLEAEHRELFEAIDGDAFDHLALYALQRHIEEEEEVLFSAALFHFDGDTWDDLEAAHHEVGALVT